MLMRIQLFVILLLLLAPVLAGAVETGQPAPPFTLPSLEGKSVSLADFKGQVVLLKLATTWCPSCAVLSAEIEKLGDFLKEREVVFLEVFLQDTEGMIRKAEEGRRFPMVHHALLDDRQVFKGYGIYTIPRLLVIGRDQTVRYDNGPAATVLPAAEIKAVVAGALAGAGKSEK